MPTISYKYLTCTLGKLTKRSILPRLVVLTILNFCSKILRKITKIWLFKNKIRKLKTISRMYYKNLETYQCKKITLHYSIPF